MRGCEISYGGAKGAIKVNLKELTKNELKRLTRRYTAMILPLIGSEYDIPVPGVGINADIMGWIMDTYSMFHGYTEHPRKLTSNNMCKVHKISKSKCKKLKS